eukprot:GHVR01090864.1.p1 GENE.GHVR01090864.1~~GHVR01090864.1.p1  ORF type:complete len:231 (+),score=23.21 GHVR01090864.1:537-1229(+)
MYILILYVNSILLFVKILTSTATARDPYDLQPVLRSVEFLGLLWWMFGFGWVVGNKPCDNDLRIFSRVLWYSQGAIYILPCLLSILLICCFPLLLIVFPYLMPTSPNQTSTADDILGQLIKVQFGYWKALLTKGKDYDEETKQSNELSGYNSIASVADLEKDCPICMMTFEDTDTVVCLPCKTQHVFHHDCVVTWLKTSQLCPICRANVPSLIEEYAKRKDTRAEEIKLL